MSRDGYLVGCSALLAARDAGAYRVVFQSVSEPVGVMATIPELGLIELGRARISKMYCSMSLGR